MPYNNRGDGPIKKLERRLGFHLEHGPGRKSWNRHESVIGKLFRAYIAFNHKFHRLRPDDCLISTGLQEESRKLFHYFGPRLWPADDDDSPSFWWLVDAAKTEQELQMLRMKLGPEQLTAGVNRPSAWWLVDAAKNGNREYPKDLYYHDEQDQEMYVCSRKLKPLLWLLLMTTTDFGAAG